MQVDDRLANWPEIRDIFWKEDVGLLLGNGASQAVWKGFSYPSLYDLACDSSREHALAAPQQAIFQEMKTSNFEAVLWSLATAKMVCKFLEKDYEDIEAHYQLIRLSLIHCGARCTCSICKHHQGPQAAGFNRRVDDAALKRAGETGSEWLSYGMTQAETRYSPLNEINAGNVSQLGLGLVLRRRIGWRRPGSHAAGLERNGLRHHQLERRVRRGRAHRRRNAGAGIRKSTRPRCAARSAAAW